MAESKSKLYQYEKTERFAVVRKPGKNRRYYCNFRFLHKSRESAETEAARLADELNAKFYVVEILSISSNGIKRKVAVKAKTTD